MFWCPCFMLSCVNKPCHVLFKTLRITLTCFGVLLGGGMVWLFTYCYGQSLGFLDLVMETSHQSYHCSSTSTCVLAIKPKQCFVICIKIICVNVSLFWHCNKRKVQHWELSDTCSKPVIRLLGKPIILYEKIFCLQCFVALNGNCLFVKKDSWNQQTVQSEVLMSELKKLATQHLFENITI